jgi:NADPH:quinone reductase
LRIEHRDHFKMPKQVIVHPSVGEYEIVDTPIPVPADKEVVIKVVVAGSNPKDWKYPFW